MLRNSMIRAESFARSAAMAAGMIACLPLPAFADDSPPGTSQIWEPLPLPSEARFTGLDISPDGKLLAITAGPEEEAGILIVPRSGAGAVRKITLPKNVNPYDPDFDATGRKILFAGYCRPHIAECTEKTTGWNIYTHDLDTGSTDQLTTPNPTLVRWRPAWGPDDTAYFVGFGNSNKLYLDSLIASSAIFKVEADGSVSDIFPENSWVQTIRRSNGENYSYIFNSHANLKSVSIIKVRDNSIIIRARMVAGPIQFTELPHPYDPDTDPRVTDRVNESFFDEDLLLFQQRSSPNTLFVVTEEAVEILYEREALTAQLPRRFSVGIAAANENRIWFPRQVKEPDYGYRWNGIHGNKVEYLSEWFTIPDTMIAFEVAGDTAVVVEKRRDGKLRLITFIDWRTADEAFLQIEQN